MMRRSRRGSLWLLPWLLVVLSCVASCAGSGGSDEGGAGIAIEFLVSRGQTGIPCRDVQGISEVEVSVFDPRGISLRSGYPRKADCTLGTFAASDLGEGDHVLEVTAYGQLGADARAVLFRARTPVSLPRDANLVVTLKPEIAFFRVGWSFGPDGDLTPCASEVAYVRVIVATGTSDDGMIEDFGCSDTPVQIPDPFPAAPVTVKVEAFSAADFKLFAHTARRVLARGENVYVAVLEPLGGQLFLDWQFGFDTGEPETRSCDDPRVGAGEVVALVHSREGIDTVSARITCARSRPIPFTAARFTAGRKLTLELLAEGVERFRAVEDFEMPDGDRYGAVLSMVPVGTATISLDVVTSSCAAVDVEYDLAVSTGELPNQVVFFESLPAAFRSVVVSNLRYGDYDVDVTSRTSAGPRCMVRERHGVRAREAAWRIEL